MNTSCWRERGRDGGREEVQFQKDPSVQCEEGSVCPALRWEPWRGGEHACPIRAPGVPTHPVGLFGGCSGKHGKESTLQIQGCGSVPSTVLFFPRDLESHLTLGSWGLQREGWLSLEEDLEIMTGAYVGLPELQMEDTRKKCQVNGH